LTTVSRLFQIFPNAEAALASVLQLSCKTSFFCNSKSEHSKRIKRNSLRLQKPHTTE